MSAVIVNIAFYIFFVQHPSQSLQLRQIEGKMQVESMILLQIR